MRDRAVVVLDCGKTLAKLSLWQPDGTMIARETRLNQRITIGSGAALDEPGIRTWLRKTLKEFSRQAPVGSIMPVGHGAAAVVVKNGRLACPAPDYEEPVPASLRTKYDEQRDPFSMTGSPALPDGLNLGVQIFRLQAARPDLFEGDAIIMPWAQYWSWLLTGTPASEVSSLGCHTDLWFPFTNEPSRLAVTQGWADRLAPLRQAGEVLGTITSEWASDTGLSRDVVVHCGLHDSNAALNAARAFKEIANCESTVLSTGTWFVGMRSPGPNADVKAHHLSETRDCLVNVDVFGSPIPSARFMGGREIESLIGLDTRTTDIKPNQPALVSAIPEVVRTGAMVLPTLAPGVGPFPRSQGGWLNRPDDPWARRAAVSLYAAMVTNASLDLVGTEGTILIEGRFAEAEVFVRALAALRQGTKVYVSNAQNDVSFGALRLLNPHLSPPSELCEVEPLPFDVSDYHGKWQCEIKDLEVAA